MGRDSVGAAENLKWKQDEKYYQTSGLVHSQILRQTHTAGKTIDFYDH